jgi:nicotinamide-nucleotide amidase
LSPESDEAVGALATRAVTRLAGSSSTVAVAESCTGGALGASITSVPGSSRVFWGGIIAYDNDAKVRLLDVRRTTLATHGAVSEPVAREMAAGIVRVSEAALGVAITGVAGPRGGTESTPVGTVFIALAGLIARCRRLQLQGGRDAIRRRSVEIALSMIADATGDDA